MKIGQQVKIRSGMSDVFVGYGVVERISPKRLVVTVKRNTYSARFYRNSIVSNRYVENPGAGIMGRALNDYFLAD
jgi:hypothetical protein